MQYSFICAKWTFSISVNLLLTAIYCVPENMLRIDISILDRRHKSLMNTKKYVDVIEMFNALIRVIAILYAYG